MKPALLGVVAGMTLALAGVFAARRWWQSTIHWAFSRGDQ